MVYFWLKSEGLFLNIYICIGSGFEGQFDDDGRPQNHVLEGWYHIRHPCYGAASMSQL